MLKVIVTFLLFAGTACRSNLTVMGAVGKLLSRDSAQILSADRLKINAGDTVVIAGLNLTTGMIVVMGNAQIPLDVKSANEASFVVPAGIDNSTIGASFLNKDRSIVSVLALTSTHSSVEIPKIDASPDIICGDIIYQDPDGHLQKGSKICSEGADICTDDEQIGCTTTRSTVALDRIRAVSLRNKIKAGVSLAGIEGSLRICAIDGDQNCALQGSTFKAALTQGLASKIIQGQTLGGITGTALAQPPDCLFDGEENCSTNSLFPAIDPTLNIPNFLRAGLSLGGITGTLSVLPPYCSMDGSTGCVSNVNFLPLSVAGAAAKIAAGYSLGGITGSGIIRPLDCASDGELGCVTNANFTAIDKAGALTSNKNKIRSNVTLAGVTGTLNVCSMEGETGCTATVPSGYVATQVSGAAAKILSGQSIAGIAGTALAKPAACTHDGDTSCLADSNYPAVDRNSVISNAGLINSILTLGGVQGTLVTCANDGDSGCFVPATGLAAGLLSGGSSKLVLGSTLGGLTGTGVLRPSDCGSDGNVGCVTSASYPSMDSATAAPRIAYGMVLGGITGSALATRPGDCSGDGQNSCVSTTTYPAMKIAAAASKIALGETLGGVAGAGNVRPTDCATDGQLACVTNANFPALDKSRILNNISKIRSAYSIAGVSGNLGDCATDGSSNCMSSASYPSANISGAGSKILNGQTLGGVSGTVAGRPTDCSSDNGIGCVANGSYPAIDRLTLQSNTNGIRSSLTFAGIAGSLNDCSTDGAIGCVSIAGYPAANASGADIKILTGQTLAGVSGTAPLKPSDCATDGEASCVSSTGLKAALITGAAAKIQTGQSLAGISGTASLKPLDCTVDGDISCVAVANFPSIDKLDKLSNANAAKIKSTLTISGISGTLMDCTTDGSSLCAAVSPNFNALDTTGAATKILTGTTLGGISGTAPIRPSDCIADGQTACVSVGNYPSIDKSNLTANATRFRSGLQVASVPGSLSDCTSDNETGCVAITGFQTVKKSTVTPDIIKSGAVVAGIVGQYPSAAYPLASSTATADFTQFSTQLTNDASFEYFDSAGNRYSARGDSDLIPNNIRTSVAIENVSLTGNMPLTSVKSPAPITEIYSSGPKITLTWQNTGAAGYILIRKTRAPVDFIPIQNATYTPGAQGANTILYVGTSTSYVDNSILMTNSYSYAVYSYDSNYYYSADPARTVDMLNLCSGLTGGTWVAVPGNLAYATNDFCIMKFEAKLISGSLTSQAASAPLTNITQSQADTYCSSLGSQYSLISNKEFMTTAANIVSVGSNWNAGIVGLGALNTGHSDNNPGMMCDSASDDSLSWVQGDCTPLGTSGDNWQQKRTHSLSTGAIIWDLAGNVSEMIKDSVSNTAKPYSSSDGAPVNNFIEINTIDSGFTSTLRNQLFPSNDIMPYWLDMWGSDRGSGLYYGGSSGTGGIMIRGGDFISASNPGLYNLALNYDGTTVSNSRGFRCTAHP